jgi:hypothetical protein
MLHIPCIRLLRNDSLKQADKLGRGAWQYQKGTDARCLVTCSRLERLRQSRSSRRRDAPVSSCVPSLPGSAIATLDIHSVRATANHRPPPGISLCDQCHHLRSAWRNKIGKTQTLYHSRFRMAGSIWGIVPASLLSLGRSGRSEPMRHGADYRKAQSPFMTCL